MERRIGVVGAGMMGSEIALVLAAAGHQVVLADRDEALARRAVEGLGPVLEAAVAKGALLQEGAADALSRVAPVAGLDGLRDADVVVEAVFEDAAVKAGVFAELDGVLREDAVLATNTSTLSVSSLAASLAPARRRRFLGAHFFSPVSRMALVEIIPGLDTDEAAVATVEALVRGAGKTPVRVADVPGFAVNRLLHAMLIEATRLVEEGVCLPQDVDTLCRLGLGHPVGPFRLMDAAKNSLVLQVQEILHAAYGERFLPRPALRRLVASGRTGRAAGRGWYEYVR